MKYALAMMATIAFVTLAIGLITIGYTIGELLWTPQELPKVAQTLKCLGVANPKCLA